MLEGGRHPGKPITCAIFAVDGPGVELRVGYSVEDIFRTQRLPDVDVARQMAAAWRHATLARGFTELTP